MAPKTRVIVLDDSALAAKIASMHLEAAGFEARAATSLDEFSAIYAEFNPDVILSDLRMPGIPEIEICSAIRREVESEGVPIYLMSGLEEEELAKWASDTGADGYMSKDVEPETLVARFRELISNERRPSNA